MRMSSRLLPGKADVCVEGGTGVIRAVARRGT